MKTKTLVAAAMAIFILAAAPALAKKNPQPPPDEGRRDEMREKVRRRLETLMLMRVAEDMNLPADKEEKLLLMLKRTLSERERKANDLQQAMRELEAVYNAPGQDSELANAISRLERIQRERNSMESDFLAELRKTLNTKETARFILLWPRVEDEMRRAVMEMKDRRGPGMRGEEPGGRPPEF